MKKYTIGIDIGGTNTDAVLLDNNKTIIASHKTTTTDQVEGGFKTAIQEVIKKAALDSCEIAHVLVGTTHATNALLQQKDLFKVGIIRINSQYGAAIPPCYGWPVELTNAVYVGDVSINGGFECDGRPINMLDEQEIKEAITALLNKGMESCAIIGVFSSLKSEQEEKVAQLVQEIAGTSFPISVSYKVGGIGFIERENATILNAALKKCMRTGFQTLKDTLEDTGINASLHLTQNNGTILPLQEALEYPILTISSGPTNSFVGSVKLTGLTDAIVVDIGGTSTDVGIVLNGFARRSVGTSTIAGIKLNFPMPDVVSIALGGGSLIKSNGKELLIGPESCAKKLKERAQCFGGDQLTLTDIAVYKKYVAIDGVKPDYVLIDEDSADIVMNLVKEKVADLVRTIAGMHMNLPVIITGGGSALLDSSILPDNYIIPDYASVANAYGAALAEISGTVDTVVVLDERKSIITQLEQQAYKKAIECGAEESTVRLISKDIMPYHYMPQNLARVKITVAGKRI